MQTLWKGNCEKGGNDEYCSKTVVVPSTERQCQHHERIHSDVFVSLLDCFSCCLLLLLLLLPNLPTSWNLHAFGLWMDRTIRSLIYSVDRLLRRTRWQGGWMPVQTGTNGIECRRYAWEGTDPPGSIRPRRIYTYWMGFHPQKYRDNSASRLLLL